ncbi:MAG TPA: TetR/AcrR family transcriptional regulator, partial [Polyangiaceae bacterium]
MPKAAREEKPRLAREDWERAALAVIAKGGVAALSIEALARELGVTKGSFYWHFADRPALLASALERWSNRYTQAVIDRLEAEADPRKRLEFLVTGTDASDRAWRVHVALSASTHEPVVASTLARISKQRIGYLESCFKALGLSKADARHRAVLGYTAFLGFLHLKLEAPAELPDAKARAT